MRPQPCATRFSFVLVALCVIGLIALAAARPVSADTPAMEEPSFRAFWADAFSTGFKSTSQINSLVSRAVQGNYNVIIPEVLAYQDNSGSGHGAYWNSDIVPKATDISGGIDPLAYLVQQAHAQGIEVHAWLVTYRVCTSWPPSGNSTVAAHPEWLMVPSTQIGGGPARIGSAYTFDPGSPDVQEYLMSIVQELVTNYDIDGINWDYIRYTQTDAGYPADTSYERSGLARFQEITGYVGIPAPDGVTSWNDFRRRTITELIRRCRMEIPSITTNPQQPLRLTADLITFGNAPGSFSSSSAYNLFQNWRLWMEEGYLDTGIPMNYKREHDSAQAAWYRNWVDASLDWRYDRQMVCGQGNYLNTKANSITQMQYALNAGSDGTCNYAYADTADEDLSGYPASDWTWYSYVSDNLFTSPAPVPAMPWRDPATAVEGSLWGQVTDPGTDLPIDYALVQVGALPATYTDGNGYYVVTLIPAGTSGSYYDVTASKDGCANQTVTDVLVMPGDVVRQDIGLCDSSIGPGDMDDDGDIDLNDWPYIAFCLQGPLVDYPAEYFCLAADADDDLNIDLADLASFQRQIGAGN